VQAPPPLNVPLLGAAVNLTCPVGVPCGVGSVSVTVAVHVDAAVPSAPAAVASVSNPITRRRVTAA
jgi:hypothetical protein